MFSRLFKALVLAARRNVGVAAPVAGEQAAVHAQPFYNARLNKAFLALALIYTLWPADLIPDFIPVLGWMDDVGILGIAAMQLWAARRKPVPVPVATRSK
jgi:uncharacterized membrane protein YkvA (DUF1232 family)